MNSMRDLTPDQNDSRQAPNAMWHSLGSTRRAEYIHIPHLDFQTVTLVIIWNTEVLEQNQNSLGKADWKDYFPHHKDKKKQWLIYYIKLCTDHFRTAWSLEHC